ncbi:NifU family protein [Kribbella sp. NPDC004875]|uniref:NifU family protein n=1 Tax=Kribbella sp. NPDC004875 TaxID=3364107 RepID=UPI0036BEBE19
MGTDLDRSGDAAAVQRVAERIDTLLDELHRQAPPELSSSVEELLQAVLSLHSTGLEHLVERLGPAKVRELAEDELIAGLLLLHDLHPDDAATRIQAALDGVRPYLGSHAGGIDYLGLDDAGVVHLRLQGSCDGCPGSTATVRLAVENAVLEAAPEAVAVDVEGMVEERRPLLTIEPFRPREDWHQFSTAPPAGGVDEFADLDLVVANPGEGLFAYRNRCAACTSSLRNGSLEGDRLTCPGCGARYDVRLAGRSLDGGEPLQALPLLPEGEGWKVAVPRRQPV